MDDIDSLRKQAQSGDISAQITLARAYQEGNGVKKNKGLYMTWMLKAAEQGSLEAIQAVISVYADRKGKSNDPQKALYWMEKAQQLGIEYTEDELANVGDPDSCLHIAESLLFADSAKHDFNKAREYMLKHHPEPQILLAWAKKYHSLHSSEKKEYNNISYLYKLATEGDADKENDLAVELYASQKKDSMRYAVQLFQESFKHGNKRAASSLLYCLINGKGVRKDMKMAVELYHSIKEKGIAMEYTFSTDSIKGIPISIPQNKAWKREEMKYQFRRSVSKVSDKVSHMLGFMCFWTSASPADFWEGEAQESTKREEDAINRAVAEGNMAAADGCRDAGCMEGWYQLEYYAFLILLAVSLVLSVIFGLVMHHIPNWLTYSIIGLLFIPSYRLAYGKAVTLSSLVLFIAAMGYGYDYLNPERSIGNNILVLCIIGFVYLWISFFIPTGLWWHHLMAFEKLKNEGIAVLYAIMSLTIVGVIGYLLFSNGLIF